MDKLQKHYSNLEQTYPQWHDNEVLINSDTTISSDMFTAQNKIYVIDTIINPSSATTFMIGNGSVLKFTRNGMLGSNCTIDCATSVEIETGMYKIFDGCTIKCFIKNGTIYPEWWGAVADGVTDDSTAINQCLRAQKRNTVYLGGSFYRVKSSISVQESEVQYDHYPSDIQAELSQSYILVNGQRVYAPEEHSKKIIIDGDIIGDETLSDPVIELLGFSQSVFICRGKIHVYSTDSKCVGVYIRSVKSSQIEIGRIIKRGTKKIGTAIVQCSQQWTSWYKFRGTLGFANGLVIIDDKFLPTFTNKATGNTKLAVMCSTWECLGIGGSNYGVYIGLQIVGNAATGSYFNDNRMYFGSIGAASNTATAFKVQTNKNSTNDNMIYVHAHDSTCARYFDLMYCQGWDLHIQGNFVDMIDANGKMYTHINNGEAIKMSFCSNCRIYPKQVFYSTLLNCVRCVNCKIYNVVCPETDQTYTTTKPENPEVWYGLQVEDTKPKFTMTATVLESEGTGYRKEHLQSNTSLTSVKVFEPERRYLQNIHYVNTLPPAIVEDKDAGTRTNHQFYALTTTEYGDMAKVYKLYDSLGREVGYIYKERYVTTEQ